MAKNPASDLHWTGQLFYVPRSRAYHSKGLLEHARHNGRDDRICSDPCLRFDLLVWSGKTTAEPAPVRPPAAVDHSMNTKTLAHARVFRMRLESTQSS